MNGLLVAWVAAARVPAGWSSPCIRPRHRETPFAARRSATRSPIAGFILGLGLMLLAGLGRVEGSPPSSVRMPKFERVQLANGTVLLMMERHDVPLIAFNARLRGGAMIDPDGAEGSASLLAGLLEKGAGTRDAFAFADAIAAVGGAIGTSADSESVGIGGSFMSRDRRLMIELLSDMLQRPRLERSQFDALRVRGIETLRATKDSDLGSLAPVYGAATLFAGRGYGKPASGSEAGLAALTHQHIAEYYRDQIGADRLILTVVGDFASSEMKSLLTRAFGGWRKARKAFVEPTAAARVAGRRVVLIDAPTSVQSYFWAGNVGVSRSYPQRAALDVANTLLGGRFTSLLNSELRIRTGLSYSASSRFERLTQPGVWQLTSFTQTAHTIDAIDLALEVLDRFHANAIDAAMIESGKAYVLGQFPLALETSVQWASALSDLEFYGLDRSYIEARAQQLSAVTLAQAQEVIRAQFPTSDNLTLVVIGNAAQIRAGLRKYGPIAEMKLADPVFTAPGR